MVLKTIIVNQRERVSFCFGSSSWLMTVDPWIGMHVHHVFDMDADDDGGGDGGDSWLGSIDVHIVYVVLDPALMSPYHATSIRLKLLKYEWRSRRAVCTQRDRDLWKTLLNGLWSPWFFNSFRHNLHKVLGSKVLQVQKYIIINLLNNLPHPKNYQRLFSMHSNFPTSYLPSRHRNVTGGSNRHRYAMAKAVGKGPSKGPAKGKGLTLPAETYKTSNRMP